VHYYDLADDLTAQRFPEIKELLEKTLYPLPVVTIDGELLSVGYVSYWMIVDALKARIPATE